MTKCINCGKRFSASNALCDDWKDPEKAYGCPACGTFLVMDMRPRWLPALVGGLAGGGIGTPAILMLVDGIRSSNAQIVVMSGSILISLLILAFIFGRTGREEVRISPYRREGNIFCQLGATTSDT